MEDLIIRGGLIIDGSGAPGYEADVAVRDGRITGIGHFPETPAQKVLDAQGLAVQVSGSASPGAVAVRVRDTGAGFDVASIAPDRLGIRGSIHARLAAVGGRSEIDCIVTDTHTEDAVIRKYEEANVKVVRSGKR